MLYTSKRTLCGCVCVFVRTCVNECVFSQILSFFGEISPFMIFECTCLCVYECTTSCLFSRYQVIFNSNHTHFFQKELDFDEANVKEGRQKIHIKIKFTFSKRDLNKKKLFRSTQRITRSKKNSPKRRQTTTKTVIILAAMAARKAAAIILANLCALCIAGSKYQSITLKFDSI